MRGLTAGLIVLARAARSGILSLLSRVEQNFRPLATKFARLHSFRERNFWNFAFRHDQYCGCSARRGFGWAKFWLRITAPASDRSLCFCTSSRADCRQNRIAKFDESLRERIRREHGTVKVVLCRRRWARNFIFAIQAHKILSLELRRVRVNFCAGQTARILGALNFRLPRRINFRSPAWLNLKPALFWWKFKACFDDQI